MRSHDSGLVLLFAPGMERMPSVAGVSEGTPLVLGREPGPGGYVVAEPGVSRRHAELNRTDGGLHIADLGSRNGVIVNGALLRRSALRSRDEVRIGDTLFKCVLADLGDYARFHPSAPQLLASAPLVGGLRMSAVRDALDAFKGGDAPVLVTGERGSGKELVARILHHHRRPTGPFREMRAAILPPQVVETELFGALAGAAAAADPRSRGLVRSAHGGTLFFEEIGDLPLQTQGKLLRLLQSREVEVGTRVDVHVVAASGRDLRGLVSEGRFRADLHELLTAQQVEMPTLRSRKEDLFALTVHFLRESGRPDLRPTADVMAALVHYNWPGNVQELERVIDRAVSLANGGPVDESHLPSTILDTMMHYGEAPSATAPSSRGDWPMQRHAERPTAAELRALLTEHDGDVVAIAKSLGKERAVVYRWVRQSGLDPDAFRGTKDPAAD